MTVPISEIAQQRTVRLVPTAYYKPPVIRALVDTEYEYDELTKLEALTNRRLTSAPPFTGIAPGWGRNYIAAAFAYTKKGGNRFNDESRGAWYAGFDDRTSLHEVAFHKNRELEYISYFHDNVKYRALHASFIGRFHDARGISPLPDYLEPRVSIGYPAGQDLAASLISVGSRGVIYPSVRHSGGTCLVAFQDNAVQDVTPGAHWQIVWNGTPNWTATAI